MLIPLIKGLATTIRHCFSKPITLQYPEEKRQVYPRFRGHPELVVTDEGKAQLVRDELVSVLSRTFDYFYPAQDLHSGRVSAPMRVVLGLATASMGPFDTPEGIVDAASGTRQVVVDGPSSYL